MALTVSVADLCQGTVFVCQEVDMPDQPNTIEVRISTLARIALNDLRKAHRTRNKELIAEAEERFDFYCDRLPRSTQQ